MIAEKKGLEYRAAGRRAGWMAGAPAFLLALCMGAANLLAQSEPPAEMVLKGKVRDFVEDNPRLTPAHPHFLGNRSHPDCSAQQFGIDIAADSIALDDDPGDTAVFPGDNRGPRLRPVLDARAAPCFEPPARFSDWYNDRTANDVNRAFLIDIRFTRDSATGVYEYLNDDFFPLDSGMAYTRLGARNPYGHLLPAPNNGHNYGFTLEFHANFTYFKGRNQVFSFRGDDDVWVFVNGKKAIELGGIHPAQDAAFNLDSIAASHGLQDSLVYPLDFFFAERHVTTSKLRITTSLELEPVTSKPSITPGRYFADSMSVTLTHPAADAVFYYTTDGSVPTVKSERYTGPIRIADTTVITAIAVRPGYRPSDPVTETYTLMQTVAKPVAVPPSRTFTDPLSVVLDVATPGAVIHYTLDETDPDSTSPVYAGPIEIAATTTIKARAYLPNWVPSPIMTEIYTDAATLPPPVADPGQGSFVTAITVSLSVPGHAEAEIRYTLDGSPPTQDSPLYSGPLTFSATTTLKARAFSPGLHPSQTLTEVYTRLSSTARAVYFDADGDGRIDGAAIRLDVPVAAAPNAVILQDPFTRAPVTVPAARIELSADGRGLTARFPDQAFTPGTSFPEADLGVFADPAYSSRPFAISDSAGPVPLKAVSRNKTSPEDHASLEVTFSEPIDLPALAGGSSWPFVILRDGVPVAAPVQVEQIVPVPGQANTYRFVFTVTSPAYPVFTDSLELGPSPLVLDLNGAAGVPGGKRIPVEGDPMNVANDFVILVTNPIVPQPVGAPAPSAQVRANPFGIVGATIPGSRPDRCLSCAPGTESDFIDGLISPEWVIRAKYPFDYAFTVFDHLGHYVSRFEGQVTPEMMAQVAQEPDGLRSMRFRWKAVAENGYPVGTGAYILKGLVQNRAGEVQRGAQGEPQVVGAARRLVLAKFGFLRQRL